jgi:hypothetical protein
MKDEKKPGCYWRIRATKLPGNQKTKAFFTGGNRGNRERAGCKLFAFSVASVTSCSNSGFLHLNQISNPLSSGPRQIAFPE